MYKKKKIYRGNSGEQFIRKTEFQGMSLISTHVNTMKTCVHLDSWISELQINLLFFSTNQFNTAIDYFT